MRHAARRGCTRFDFGRSKLGTGAFAFKKNWGFEPEPIVHAVRTAGLSVILPGEAGEGDRRRRWRGRQPAAMAMRLRQAVVF